PPPLTCYTTSKIQENLSSVKIFFAIAESLDFAQRQNWGMASPGGVLTKKYFLAILEQREIS
ncbi:MAG TPA: hypothetical protein VMU21_05815, partial [Thermodesulfovibrionales bacterium]|nr:hypothetical protein [Thermodesulfovibrionales bacterium]